MVVNHQAGLGDPEADQSATTAVVGNDGGR